MPGSTIGIYMNYGYPGQASRHGDEVSRTRAVDKTSEKINFGAPVVLTEEGKVKAWGADSTADKFNGVAMRKVKSAKIYPYQNLGYYEAGEPCDMLQRGGISVICAWGTPTVGGKVYIRTAVGEAPNENSVIGDFGAEDDTGKCVELPGAKWSSDKDSRNVAEITLLTRQGV